MKGPLAIALIAAGAMFAGTSAQAAFITYFGEDLNNSATVPLSSTPNSDAAESAFLGSLSGVGTEDFEGFATGTGAPLNLTFPGFGGGSLDATLTGDGRIKTVSEGSAYFGRYSVSGTNTWRADATGDDGFGVDFGQDIAAFGFYGIDIGDFGGQLLINFNLSSGGVHQETVPHTVGSGGSTDGSVFYFGAIASSEDFLFTSLDFDLVEGPQTDIFSFDNMTIGELEQVEREPVPAPGTLVLLASGLLLVAGSVFWRRKRSDSGH